MGDEVKWKGDDMTQGEGEGDEGGGKEEGGMG